MRIATVEQIKNIDKTAIEEYGIKEIVLMENAGRAVARAAFNLLENNSDKTVFVAAGMGNNGGDALVAARHLLNFNLKVKIFLLGNIEHFTGSARSNYAILLHMGAELYFIKTPHDWDKVRLGLNLSDIVIDGLCGTGVRLPLKDDYKKMIAYINNAGKSVIAIDIPSGVNADNGTVSDGQAVKATTTVTLGIPKIGNLLYPGVIYTGKLLTDSIGIPLNVLNDTTIKQRFIDKNLTKKFLLPRPMNAYKGSCGRVLVIAGSTGYTGAASLCSQAALRAGAGLVTLGTAESLYPIFAGKMTEVIVKPLPEEKPGILGISAINLILPREESYDSILIGPGLGRDTATLQFVRELVNKIKKPVILDADAIFAFSGHIDELAKCFTPPILTPHLGEMANLLQIKVKELKADLWSYARRASIKYNSIFILKSEKTIVACPDGNIFLTTVGNQGMATAGCGDVLAGITAAIRAETDAKTAAIAAVYLHGKAGDIAAQHGMIGLIASDIMNNIQTARANL